MDNVRLVLMEKRCMSCGGCSSVCPTDAIRMVYREQEGFFRPVIEEAVCVGCGRCMKVCPAEHQENTALIGEYCDLYLAHSKNIDVRHGATSGGVINTLVRYLLDINLVEAVVMAGYSSDSPIEAEPYILTRSDINDLEQNPRDFASRYVTVPVLSKIKEVNNMKSIAVVGTSCQINALKLMGSRTLTSIFRIGITCSGGMSYKATTEYKRVQHLQSAKMFYRGDGWPGKNCLITKDKCKSANHSGSLFERMFSSQIFKNPGCRYCKDYFAENADISFCDFWNKSELSQEHEGNSCVIARSKLAQELMQKMQNDNYIEVVRKLSETEIESTQMHVLKAKKGDPHQISSYRHFLKVIDFVFEHGIYKLFGLKTYQLFCRKYSEIMSKVRLE